MIEIQVNNLVKSFEVGKNVLDGLTFQVDQGERVGLLGRNGAGKTTLFNRLTGARQVTGNWPGVTVERKEGQVKGRPWTLVDLPGIYSLASYSPEEKAAASFLEDTPPDLVLNIVDATALERNLYLTLQQIGRASCRVRV